MQNEPFEPRLSEAGTYEEVFRDGETVLLTARARWPRLEAESPGLKRINRYYDALADRWKQRWAGPLLESAKVEASPESAPWEVSLDFAVTLSQDGLLSFRLDAVEQTGERRPRRVRQGDVWRVPSGTPVTLRELLPANRWWKGPVIAEIRRQIGARVQSGEAVFFEDWLRLASRKFSPGRFYLTPDGPVVFYPVESVAPAMEGFPTFSLLALTERKDGG